jgi:hypothetical protein
LVSFQTSSNAKHGGTVEIQSGTESKDLQIFVMSFFALFASFCFIVFVFPSFASFPSVESAFGFIEQKAAKLAKERIKSTLLSLLSTVHTEFGFLFCRPR